MNRKTSTRTWLRGNQTTYIPMIPAIAPDAPRVRDERVRIHHDPEHRAHEPARQIDDQVAEGAEDLLDVIPEDPEIEHVPGQVEDWACRNIEVENREPDRERNVILFLKLSDAACPAGGRSGEPSRRTREGQRRLIS